MELNLIEWLSREFGSRPALHRSLRLGIGDDAAVFKSFGTDEIVVTHDTLVEGVHFVLANGAHRDVIGLVDEVTLANAAQVGYKAVAVNLSDLAAMAAEPVAIIVGIVLPRGAGLETAQNLFLGMKPLLEQFDVALAGGDTNSSTGPLTIGVTAIGKVTASPNDHSELEFGRSWLRNAAKPGDQILVTGELGGSILGKHLRFTPRVSEALALRRSYNIHAAIDISDGLLLDLDRVCKASGCGAEIDLQTIPVSGAATELCQVAGLDGLSEADRRLSPLDHALTDGEDFELLLTVTPETWREIQADSSIDFRLTRIGEIVSGDGLFSVNDNGREELKPAGFVHDF